MRKIIFGLLLSVAAQSFANGNRVGNGGKGIVCTAKNGHQDVQILDFYESTLKLRADLEKLPREESLKKVFENLQRLAPELEKQYSRRASEIMSEIEFKADADLTATPDSFELALPKKSNCKLRQLVIRRTETDDVTKPFLFDEDLWKVMNPGQQSGLLLHEIVYEHFWKLGEPNSVKARKITAYLASEKAAKDTPEEFWSLIKSLKLPIYR